MITVGLTGGIGSGKSTVSKIFESIDIPVFNSDLEARNLFELDEVKKEIKKHFGEEVFTNNLFDRAKMAAIVFNNRQKLEELNAIIHPRVSNLFQQWAMLNKSHKYLIKESAILFEYSLNNELDKTILVYTPVKTRIQRVVQRDGLSEKQVTERIKNQLPDELKIAKANFVINNYDNFMLIPQVLDIHQKLTNQ